MRLPRNVRVIEIGNGVRAICLKDSNGNDEEVCHTKLSRAEIAEALHGGPKPACEHRRAVKMCAIQLRIAYAERGSQFWQLDVVENAHEKRR